MDETNIGEADIAIVGMAARLPGARDIDTYWRNLVGGVESLTALGDDDLERAGVPEAVRRDPDYVKAGMFLEDMEMFDAGLFGFSPRDASILDPQHRHFLEVAWEALEHAGHDPARFAGSIGVFGGSGHNAYMPYNLLTNPALMRAVGFFLIRHTGNDKDFLTTRVSYLLDLKGPSINVATACSTSLVAAHLAAQSLLNGECDMALAGGVTIELPHRHGYTFKEGEILAPDGHCRPFDAAGAGTLFGSGAGIVVLRRLEDALADGDTVHAVIKGSAVNNDGSGKVSYLAPSVDGQTACINEALRLADVDPTSIGYVECHGTGTAIGDPIEVQALSRAFGARTDAKQFCGIGSVKSNIGHLDTAAGVASLIKAVLSLQHGQIPASLNYTAPNPEIDFPDTPFYVNAALRKWSAGSRAPRRAAVNSLGVGGTNAFCIVEQAPAQRSDAPAREYQLLPISARTPEALERNTDRLIAHLEQHPEVPMADVAYTLQVGRASLARRRVVAARDAAEAASLLRARDPQRVITAAAGDKPCSVAFAFAGGGAQFPNMGRDLYEGEPVYREAVDRCLAVLRGTLDFNLRALMYPAPADEQAAAVELQRPTRTLTSLFTTQYAQAMLWRSWGVVPAALVGHSMGENTAACLAGVLSLEDALGLVALRGKLFEQVERGGMISVSLAAEELAPLLGDGLSIGVINAPGYAVASGPIAAIEQLERTLTERDVDFQRVRIEIAAHSAMLDPILERFGAYLRSIRLSPPTIPLLSNVSGTWMAEAEATSPDYWVRHLRSTVRFSDCAKVLLEEPGRVLLEVGPGRTLTSLAQMQPGKSERHALITSMGPREDDTSDVAFMLGALGRLWQAGVPLDTEALHRGERRLRVPLPTYAFDHARHWIEPGARLEQAVASDGPARLGESDWLYAPTWTRAPARRLADDRPRARYLVFTNGSDLAAGVVAALREVDDQVIAVTAGPMYARLGANAFTLRAGEADDYVRLVRELSPGGLPRHWVHLWNLWSSGPSGEAPADARAYCFDSLVSLARALADEDVSEPLSLTVVSSGGQQVAFEPVSSPLQTMAAGACRVIATELPNVRARVIDVAIDGADDADLAPGLVAELTSNADEPLVALRGRTRFRHDIAPARSGAPTEPPAEGGDVVRCGGVYLITGGLGGLGLLMGETLATQGQPVTLALLGRRGLPPRDEWAGWVAKRGEDDPTSRKIARVRAMEAAGATVEIAAVDITDEPALRALVADLRSRHGGVHGVIHAAGVLDDALLQLKTAASIEAVLAPKVAGTMALDRALAGESLDFMVLFSSISAFAGLPGQVDYAAANAFLEGYAHQRQARDGTRVIAIDWTAWKQVGMVAARADGSADATPPGRPASHPCLGAVIEGAGSDDVAVAPEAQRVVYAGDWRVEDQWLLSEHRVRGGVCVIPGAGYLELARAAFCEARGAGGVELQDALFISPFRVPDGECRELRIELTGAGERDVEVSMSSRVGAGWQEHARCTVARLRPDALPARAAETPATIRARCSARTELFTDPDHHPHMDFGPRWASLRRIDVGAGEALATLELDPAFAGELDTYRLHPAILDMAAAGVQSLHTGYDAQRDFFVPVGCARLRFRGDMPSTLLSHVRYRPSVGAHGGDVALFDVTLMDPDGRVIAAIEEFQLKRLTDHASMTRDAAAEASAVDPGEAALMERTLATAIAPDEGARALMRVLRSWPGPQVAVATHELSALIDSLKQPREPVAVATAAHDADADPDLPVIEAALVAHEAVEAAVVRAHRDAEGGRRLVAHIVFAPGEHATGSELRAFVAAELDAERVPHHVVELDELPRTATGEVDRASLVDPLGPIDDYVAPRTDTEKAIAAIWRDVLGADRIGLHDNFFDAGGHSLLSIRVITRINKQLGVRLNQAIMALQTLEQIAREVEQRAEPPAGPSAAPPPSAPAPTPSSGLLGRVFGRNG